MMRKAEPVSRLPFTPATTKLGTGEVNIALSLAEAELSKLGISPTHTRTTGSRPERAAR